MLLEFTRMSSWEVDLCDIKRSGHYFEGVGEARFEHSSFYMHGLARKDVMHCSHTSPARSRHLDGSPVRCGGKFGSEANTRRFMISRTT